MNRRLLLSSKEGKNKLKKEARKGCITSDGKRGRGHTHTQLEGHPQGSKSITLFPNESKYNSLIELFFQPLLVRGNIASEGAESGSSPSEQFQKDKINPNRTFNPLNQQLEAFKCIKKIYEIQCK